MLILFIELIDDVLGMAVVCLLAISKTRTVPQDKVVQLISGDLHGLRVCAYADFSLLSVEKRIDRRALADPCRAGDHQVDLLLL